MTYVPMARGFVYLVAIIDWYSRKVLSWRVSITLDASFCTDALEEAIETHGVPQIFNTDQGSQFTSDDFTGVLKRHGIRISMDGKGRWVDNVFVERLWRSVKYEEVYLKAYDSITAARMSLGRYFDFYNTESGRTRLIVHPDRCRRLSHRFAADVAGIRAARERPAGGEPLVIPISSLQRARCLT